MFIAEVPDSEPALQIVLKAADADTFTLDPGIEVVTAFEDTHWGTR